MPGDANWSTRLDSTLKSQAEEILSDVGMTMSGVFTMLLKQIVRERSIPLSLSLDSSNAIYADLLEAQTDRLNGYQGRNARDVLRDMEQAIAEVEARRKIVTVNYFEGNMLNVQYTFDSVIKVNIYEDLFIDFSDIADLLNT